MRLMRLMAGLVLVLCAAMSHAGDGPRFGVRITDAVWHDAARDRDLPVRIYMPKVSDEAGKLPLIVFSHGLGGSGEMYGYFGRHMAEMGYVVIAPTHHGSDTAALRDWAKTNGFGKKNAEGEGWLQAGISDPENLRNRPKDISFVIDQASKDAKLAAAIDMNRIGVAGHSFGAYTAMAIGGMKVDLPEGKAVSFRDPRVKAVLPMSPEGSGTMGITKESWNAFAVPVLFLTGTNDYGNGGRAASWRREGFDRVNGVDDYLFTIEGATHMTFGGGGGGGDPATEDRTLRGKIKEKIRERVREKSAEKSGGMDKDVDAHIELVESYSGMFFDAYLRDDADAKERLRKYASEKHADCVAEFKPGSGAGK